MALFTSELEVLMLPGFGCDADSMLELDVALNGNQCIKHVKHMLFAAETSLDEMVRTIENKYQHSELLLVGFSMGGWVAQAVASKLRSNVKGMILISSWTEAPSQYLQIIKSLVWVIALPSRTYPPNTYRASCTTKSVSNIF